MKKSIVVAGFGIIAIGGAAIYGAAKLIERLSLPQPKRIPHGSMNIKDGKICEEK